MKKILYPAFLTLVVGFTACHKDNDSTPTDPNKGNTFTIQGDQVARPGFECCIH